MNNWNTNELYQTIHHYIDDNELADNVFSAILPYMLETYGENGITNQNLCFIMPGKLYKHSIANSTSYYKDLSWVICKYKSDNNLDIGFPLMRYEELFNTNIKYENALKQKRLVKEQHKVLALEKKMKKQKCKQAVVKKEDFDKDLIITRDNIIKYLHKQYKDIEFLTDEQITNSFSIKNLTNQRVGSLVYGTPLKINSIKDQSVYWIGMCDCGNYRVSQGGRVDEYQNCPVCEKPEHIYLGERCGHLEVIEQRYLLNGKHSLTLKLKCKCDCGSEIIVSPAIFAEGVKTNCGKQCKYAIESRHENGKQNTKNIKRVFHKETNFTKIGRTESNANSSTGYLGVTFVPATGTYMAYITFQGKTEMLGSTYKTAEQAYAVRLAAQNILHKEYLNQMENDEFVKQNKYLTRLLKKAKAAVNVIDEIVNKERV